MKKELNPQWIERNTRLEKIKKYHHLIADIISWKFLMEKLKEYRKKALEERELLKKELKNKDSS